jgi:Ig domain protein group 2 domain protein
MLLAACLGMAQCIPEEKEIRVTGITLDASTLKMKVGESKQLTATVEPADANQKVTWRSGKEEVATVDAEGNVKGLKAGTATITATTVGKDEHGNPKKAECVVTVEGIVLQEKLTITLYGRWALAATVFPAGSELEWSSADAEVVNIADGFAYGKKLGTTTVTASLKDDPATKAQCEVTVDLSEEVKIGVYLNRTGCVLQQEQSFDLFAKVNGKLVNRCTWQSSDESIASVSRGKVTAKKKAGEATITVYYGGRTATCLVAVAKNSYPAPNVTGIRMGVRNCTIVPGEAHKKLSLFSVFPRKAATKDVILSSNNALAVKVDPHTGVITGVHPDAANNVGGTVSHSGVATITAITVDGHKTGKYTAVTKYRGSSKNVHLLEFSSPASPLAGHFVCKYGRP